MSVQRRIKARAHVGLAVLADRSDLSQEGSEEAGRGERQIVQQALFDRAHHFVEARVGSPAEPFATAAPTSWEDEGGAPVAGSWPSPGV